MIEFKAECGHTIRAKDDDAGGKVRCTYCGKETGVPDSHEDALDFLFNDSDTPTEAMPSPRRRRFGRNKNLFSSRTPKLVDPFSIILRMCYIAGVVTIVFWVGREYLLPLFQAGGVSRRMAETPSGRRQQGNSPPSAAKPSRSATRTVGLLTRKPGKRLYVGSTPPRATVHYIVADLAPEEGSICETVGVQTVRANGQGIKLPDGKYVVEVGLLWNDTRLQNPDMPNYHDYMAFRRKLVNATVEQRAVLVEKFFVPDEASRVFVHETDEQMFLVRQYRDVQIRGGTGRDIRALFIPRITFPDREGFSIAAMVQHYIPTQKTYGFSRVQARIELDFYDVPESDRLFVIEVLERIGLVPFVTPDGITRLFKIGVDDGIFATKTLHDAGR